MFDAGRAGELNPTRLWVDQIRMRRFLAVCKRDTQISRRGFLDP
jgi:hypothetical protein